jgi:hypothetical protein
MIKKNNNNNVIHNPKGLSSKIFQQKIFFICMIYTVEENGVHREKHGPATNHWQTLSHNVVSPERDSNA